MRIQLRLIEWKEMAALTKEDWIYKEALSKLLIKMTFFKQFKMKSILKTKAWLLI